MSVLIKGMKIPQNCCECPLTYYEDASCLFTGIVALSIGRQVACPLVEVPPHGRLIDENWLRDAMITTLEALKKNPKMDGQEMHLIAAFDTLRAMLEDAPTIIEAEVER